MSVDRRELIQILGAGIAATPSATAQHRHGGGAPNATTSYVPRALTAAEYATLDRLAEILLPADENTPGAHDAGVARYIDIVLLYGDKSVLATWKSGIAAVESIADAKYGRPLIQLAPAEQTAIVETIARNETSPETEAEKFFVLLKRLAIEAFYLSSAGRQSLGYKGNTAVSSFPGCTHPEHAARNLG